MRWTRSVHLPPESRAEDLTLSGFGLLGMLSDARRVSLEAAQLQMRAVLMRASSSARRWHGRFLVRLLSLRISLKAFELDLDALDRHGVGVGVEIGHGGKFADPALVEKETLGHMPFFIHDLESQFLFVIHEVHGRVAGEWVDEVGPLLELRVMGDAAFHRERVVGGASGRFVVGAVLAAGAVFDDLGGAFERAGLADSQHGATIPDDAEFVVLVGVETMRVNDESIGHILISGCGVYPRSPAIC